LTLSPTTRRAIDGWARKFITADQLPARQTERLTRQVVRVVETNIGSGRFANFVRASAPHTRVTLRGYVQRVAQSVQDEHARIAALARNDETTWRAVQIMLTGRAYRILCHVRDATVAHNEAADFANETCRIIFAKTFPFDVAFDAWATKILRNAILQTYARSPDVLNHEPSRASLDAPIGEDGQLLGETVPQVDPTQPFDLVEDRAAVCEAVKRLRSAPQRRAVQAICLEGKSVARFARQEGISEQAVYNLCHRAVKKIRQILALPHEQETHGKSHQSSKKSSRTQEAK